MQRPRAHRPLPRCGCAGWGCTCLLAFRFWQWRAAARAAHRRAFFGTAARLTQLVDRHRLRLGQCPLNGSGGDFADQLRKFISHHSGLTLGVAAQEQGIYLGGPARAHYRDMARIYFNHICQQIFNFGLDLDFLFHQSLTLGTHTLSFFFLKISW